MDDPIHERGKAIEDLFFAQSDQKLLAKLKEELTAKEKQEALAIAAGISDETALRALVNHNITAETLLTVGLIPLVAVAWADRIMEIPERKAIMKAAEEVGIEVGTSAHAILQEWLNRKPSPELLDSWKAYIRALKASLDPTSMNQLRDSIMGRAREVARSAGGVLGIGPKISKVEQEVIDDLSSTFA
jgi:hypothetical protein